MRLLIWMLCALGLAFAPVAANAAAASRQGPMIGCDMHQKVPGKPAGHGKMDCCTPACQAASPAALLPQRDGPSARLISHSDLRARLAAEELESFAPTGLDPPPRLRS